MIVKQSVDLFDHKLDITQEHIPSICVQQLLVSYFVDAGKSLTTSSGTVERFVPTLLHTGTVLERSIPGDFSDICMLKDACLSDGSEFHQSTASTQFAADTK